MARKAGWKKVAKQLFTLAIVSVVCYVFFGVLSSNWSKVVEMHIGFSWWYAGAFVSFGLAVPLAGLLWSYTVEQLGAAAKVPRLGYVINHCSSWLLRYLPGQIGSQVSKVVWGGSVGLSRTLIVVSVVYENAFLLVSALLPSVVVLLAIAGPSLFSAHPVLLALPVLSLVPLGLLLHSRVFRWLIEFGVTRVLKMKVGSEYFLRDRATLVILAGYLAPRLLNAVGFAMVALAHTNLSPEMWWYFGAAYLFAGAVGVLAVFVPSGIGVRELVLVAALLAVGSDASLAVVLAILSRLITTLSDLLVGGISFGVGLATSRRSSS